MACEPPGRLVKALTETAPEGDDWLASLPRTVRQATALGECAVERVQEPGGRSSLVLLVRGPDGAPEVLKLAPPRARPEAERAALARWDGLGAVRLLRPGAAGPGTLLLERLRPDVSVRSLPESRALLEAAGTLRRLWVTPPEDHPFETVADRTLRQARAIRAGADVDPELAPLATEALAAREELVTTPPEQVLLHGTFRQSKVLAADRMPWLAVGPDPVVGERAFDLARLVRDRVEDLIAQPSGAATTRRRVRRLAESLEVDQERLRGWTLFRAVESGARARRVGRARDAELLLEFAGWL
ncbi:MULTISPECIES: aminoglycoside phosphotransferase family protein [unclassified Streptomyces]|uniref:aminoglycoside phosphotransferase family protein n=1 Tax=unclassified Streptomyces TaxID=2593676 RepID=UPI0019046B0D|nr:aminoglycoside phosphotransferase family protein [Streptomyces sp. HSG2]